MKSLPRPIVIVLSVIGFFILGFVSLHVINCRVIGVSCEATVVRQSEALAPNYSTYTQETLREAQASEKKIVLYFWAPWCTSCTSLDIELKENEAKIPDEVMVLRVDYDSESVLKQKYQVVTQHTFVQIDQNGEMLSGWVGGDIENFAKYLK